MERLSSSQVFSSTVVPPRPSFWTAKTLWAGGVIVAIALSLTQVGFLQGAIFNPAGMGLMGQFFQASLHPDLSPDFLQIMARATVTTLAYAVTGTALSVVLGLIGGLLSSEMGWQTLLPSRSGSLNQAGWLLMRSLLAVPRAIHELIWGLFFVNILGLDPLVAVLAIAIPFGAITAKVFSEIFDETPRQPWQALLNSGISPLPAFLYGLLPQALPNVLSYCFYRLECSVRSAAVLGIIGAGGLGYEIFLSLKSLRYEQLWTGFYALILLTGAVDVWSATLRRRMGFTSRLDLNLRRTAKTSQPQPTPQRAQGQDRFVKLSWIGVALAIPGCMAYLQLDWTTLIAPRTQRLLAEVTASAFPPTLDGPSFVNLVGLSVQTLAMSVLAMTLAGGLGVCLSFSAANNFFLRGGLLEPLGPQQQPHPIGRLFWLLSRAILLVGRSIPAPIWALVFLFGLFPGILPGAIALGVHNLGILGRLMAEVNENLDDRGVRSLRALGASSAQIVLYGILPQNLPRFLAYILYRWEVCIRATVIVGLVGAGGLGRLLTEQLSSFDYAGVVSTLGVFIALTFLVDLISGAARQALR